MVIAEYRISVSCTHDGLADAVNEWIADGWLPIGGPAATVIEGKEFLYQAMIKTEADPRHTKPPRMEAKPR